MKRFLLVFGYFISIIIITGTIFKLQHWPGSGLMLTVGVILLTTFFFPLFFIQRMIENRSGLNITVNLFLLISIVTTFEGVLFKVQHWPGAGLMLVIGSFILMGPAMILYIVQQFVEYDKKFHEFWKAVFSLTFASIFFLIYGLNVSRSIIESYLNIEDATLLSNTSLEENNQLLISDIKTSLIKQNLSTTVIDSIEAKTKRTLALIEQIKKELIQNTESNNKEAITDHWQIRAKDNFETSTYMLGRANSDVAIDLHDQLNRYSEFLKMQIQKLKSENNIAIDSKNLNIDLKIDKRMNFDNDRTWQEQLFYNMTLVGTLTVLTSLQNQVLNAEFKTLNRINHSIK